MQESAADPDELDLALIHALQLDPRAPWSRVGTALGVDAVTAARRWSRLAEAGIAWVTAHPVGLLQTAAFIEVDCEAGEVLATAATLARWPHVVSIEHTSGAHDLLLTVATPGLNALSRYLRDGIGTVAGVRATRTQLVTRAYALGGDWRLGALDARQLEQMGSPVQISTGTVRPLPEVERRLLRLLCHDGRASLTELAVGLGCGLSTVRRRLRSMIADRALVLRCDVAQPLSGWPVCLTLSAQSPADQLVAIANGLATLPETRSCAITTGGSTNVVHSTWLRSLHDAHRLELLLAERYPALRITDRAVTLGHVKRTGRLLDDEGRSIGIVPMDVWTDPVEAARAAGLSRSGITGG
ncbi:Lrp/AsnC family transcriptional regulator [Streptomyces albipurpureus]|uniref:AsnC family transcriptional regulator n=1 Tax=Streptomyces albipurpureus TaxID=2897419 RepID=A0ABT0UYE2_9ACTN|nr:AsnC family transcriptional regulator [Streptomyces sp. CWNU-1]MCM2393588.1 AsnC family transcriptional regulator [Streptomyces sp. CWNU-1]